MNTAAANYRAAMATAQTLADKDRAYLMLINESLIALNAQMLEEARRATPEYKRAAKEAARAARRRARGFFMWKLLALVGR